MKCTDPRKSNTSNSHPFREGVQEAPASCYESVRGPEGSTQAQFQETDGVPSGLIKDASTTNGGMGDKVGSSASSSSKTEASSSSSFRKFLSINLCIV